MKRLLTILSVSFLLIVGAVQTADAQKAKAVKKAIELVTKGAKKTPKKISPGRSIRPRQTTPRPRLHISTVSCSQCSGKGFVTVWNSYSSQYNTVVCSKCSGKGRVKSN